MSGLNFVKNTISKNGNLLRQIRPLHTTSARSFKAVAQKESLNSEYVVNYVITKELTNMACLFLKSYTWHSSSLVTF